MKNKLTWIERLIVISIGILTVMSLFIPWAEYGTPYGLLVIADNSFIGFTDLIDSSPRIDSILACAIGLFLFVFVLIAVSFGGWRRIVWVVSWLAGGCTCLLTFLSIGIGPGKIFGFYMTMLCGIALIAFIPIVDRLKNNKCNQ